MIAGTGNENARARKQLGLRSSSSMRTNFWRHYRTLAVGIIYISVYIRGIRIKYKRKTSFVAVSFRQINNLLGKYVQETSRAVLA